MRPSIRTFLLINLLLSVTLVTSMAIVGSLFIAHKKIQSHLDLHLIDTAKQIHTFIDSQYESINWQKLNRDFQSSNAAPSVNTNDHTIFQIWQHDRLLLKSSIGHLHNRFDIHKIGFKEEKRNSQSFRTYTLKDYKNNYTIVVAQPEAYRQQLENRLSENSIYLLLATYPLLGILVWFIVRNALKPVNKIAKQVHDRKAAYLEPVSIDNIPAEIKPLTDSLNHLFKRLDEAFEREKRFASDAAHEMRTPLAVLSTQAQIALKATDTKQREDALRKVLNGVERSSHIIHQLLTMSRMVPQASIHQATEFDIVKHTTDMIGDLINSALNKNIELSLDAPEHLKMTGSSTAIAIMIRNLIDNAIRYTPENGTVDIQISENTQDKTIRYIVSDTGPGIAKELRERVFERFFRVIGNKASGSGLGLGIVKQIVELHQGSIELGTADVGHGLKVTITLPSESKR